MDFDHFGLTVVYGFGENNWRREKVLRWGSVGLEGTGAQLLRPGNGVLVGAYVSSRVSPPPIRIIDWTGIKE